MKILHASDVHAERTRWPECATSLDTLAAAGSREAVDAFILSGDLAHGPLQDSERDVFDALCGKIQVLAGIAPVAIIYGTPTHDAPGSLEVYERLAAAHPITILRPGVAYLLTAYDGLVEIPADDPTARCDRDDKALLFGIPEPQKKWLLAGIEATGKDDSDALVRQAMAQLCLGLGALRRQHADLPCVVAYHGEIGGARSATGYQSEVGTGLALSRDDLAAIGADYYACGHIHEPQMIQVLPAYYAGSAYAINWGETHKPGANLVEISDLGPADPAFPLAPNGFVARISRIEFPHPQRAKIGIKFGDTFLAAQINGRQTWLEITATREEAAGIDVDASLAALLAAGALPGSRVTINVLPTETVRAAEIVDKKKLRDKIKIYGEASETTIPESVLKLADELEREREASGQAAGGARIRLDRLRLRGAIGLWKKSKKDEVDIDFEALGEGVLAFGSPNGAGKTTILENCHPWPCMLTRDGKLSDHFRLRDSARELWFTDERSGYRYKALITIRADLASPTCEYYLHVDKGSGFEPVEGVTGRKEAYEAEIGRLWGSLAMFLQTAFVTQRQSKFAPDLSGATVSERKALFGELAGLEYMQAYAAAAHARTDARERALVGLDASISAAEGVDVELERYGAEILAQREAEEDSAGRALVSSARAVTLKTEYEGLRTRVAEVERQAERKGELEREVASLLAEIKAAEDGIALFRAAAARRGETQERLDAIAGLEARATVLRGEKAAVDEANHNAVVEHSRAAAAARARQDEARTRLDQALADLAQAEKAEALARAQVDPAAEGKLGAARAELGRYEVQTRTATKAAGAAAAELERLRKEHAEARALPALLGALHDGEACPLCGGLDHPAPAHADAERLLGLEGAGKLAAQGSTEAQAALLEASRAEERARGAVAGIETTVRASQAAQEDLAALESETRLARNAVEAAQAFLAGIEIPPPPEPAPFPGAEELAGIEDELTFADAEGLREILRQADEAAVRIEGATKAAEAARSRSASAAAEAQALAPAVEALATWQGECERKGLELEAERGTYTRVTSAAAAAHASLEAAERAQAGARERAARRDKAKAERETTAAELADWRLLERAVGPNGIQALELDALAPSITDVANKLLAVISPRYALEIRTQREAGKGKSAKMVEDFEIYILDTETGDEQTIDSLSGGEAVWIRKALYSAFGIIRARNAGAQFLTAFLDEADGALDSESKMLYLRMLQAEHRESGRFQTLLVTHSRELQAMVDRTINVEEFHARDPANEELRRAS